MKPGDLRAMTVDQLDDEALKLKKERFNLRFQRATGQLENTARVRLVRRDIARVKTIAALKRAALSPSDIDYVNAHGTSTPIGDEIELHAVERLLGNSAAKATMSSTKSATGHLLGAAGAVESIFCLLAMRDNIVPPTINLDNPSVDTAIDLVPHKPREKPVNIALSNSFGFGGTNASLVFRRLAE